MAYFRIGLVLVFASAFFFQTIKAQSLTQTVKGVVVDADAESPLIGATVMVVGSEPLIATTTDIDGQFKLENVPIGRQTLEIRYLGFETGLLPNLVVTSGKELVVKVGLTETTETLEEVVVKASDNKQEPTNEMASVSARSFSVEETQRYAASLLDPARMAQTMLGYPRQEMTYPMKLLSGETLPHMYNGGWRDFKFQVLTTFLQKVAQEVELAC